MLAIILIVAGILLRIAPHAPNFTPVAAIAIFAAAYLNKKYALLIPLLLMAVSDFFIGAHNVLLFTWAGFLLAGLVGFWVRSRKNLPRILAGSLFSSFLFYLVSNFGVWLMGWYPPTTEGLVNCYIMALPFLRNFALATIFYSLVFFGAYEFIAARVKNTRFASVLLTN